MTKIEWKRASVVAVAAALPVLTLDPGTTTRRPAERWTGAAAAIPTEPLYCPIITTTCQPPS